MICLCGASSRDPPVSAWRKSLSLINLCCCRKCRWVLPFSRPSVKSVNSNQCHKSLSWWNHIWPAKCEILTADCRPLCCFDQKENKYNRCCCNVGRKEFVCRKGHVKVWCVKVPKMMLGFLTINGNVALIFLWRAWRNITRQLAQISVKSFVVTGPINRCDDGMRLNNSGQFSFH